MLNLQKGQHTVFISEGRNPMITFKSMELIRWFGFNEIWFIYPLLFMLFFTLAIKKIIEKDNFDGVCFSILASIVFTVMYGTLLWVAF